MIVGKKKWENIYYTNATQKKAGVTILTSDQVDFWAKKIIRNNDEYCVIIKWSSHQEDNFKCAFT